MENDAEGFTAVLVMGASALDHLLCVPEYPQPDAKIRTTANASQGGGNAANTAHCLGLLSKKSQLKVLDDSVQVQLATKLGDDVIGRQLREELQDTAGVSVLDFSTRVQTTSSCSTIIADQSTNTRTCFFTPGSCGELEASDLTGAYVDPLSESLLAGVVHFHSDSRFAAASLLVAQSAKNKDISVSVDVERDRNSQELDELLVLADMVFTSCSNSKDTALSQSPDSAMFAYIQRLTKAAEEERSLLPLPEPTVYGELDLDSKGGSCSMTIPDILSISSYFSRFHGQVGKEVVMTFGDLGALRLTCIDLSQSTKSSSQHTNWYRVVALPTPSPCLSYFKITHTHTELTPRSGMPHLTLTVIYRLELVGVVNGLDVVDTTGAGDAFAGGYIWGSILNRSARKTMTESQKNKLQNPASTVTPPEGDVSELQLGCWAGGKSVKGLGARSALPSAKDLQGELGADMDQIRSSLSEKLGPFGAFVST